MNLLLLALNSIKFFWRSLLGVVLGVTVASTVLTGALIVGDCVHFTLRAIALERLGNIDYALTHPSRFFNEALANRMAESLKTTIAPVYHTNGMMNNTDNNKRANQVSVYGVDSTFWQLATTAPSNPIEIAPNSVVINQPLAHLLEVEIGDSVILRVENPSSLSRELPMSTTEDSSLALRLNISKIISSDELGNYQLRTNQTHPNNAFVSLDFLQEQTERVDQINTLLIHTIEGETPSSIELNLILQQHWTLEDLQLTKMDLSDSDLSEIRSERIFLESPIQNGIESALANQPDFGVLTYFVNQLQHADRSTPYSMVSALEVNAFSQQLFPVLEGLNDDEIIINQWLADDLNIEVGESLTLTYYLLGTMRELVEEENTFRVKAIIPMDHPLSDRYLMPDFPGIVDIDNTRDWDPGFNIDLDLIRDKDEDYWDDYRGTPKAYISLAAGQSMWQNRWGGLTAIRFAQPNENNPAPGQSDTATMIAQTIPPSAAGLMFQPVRAAALRAVNQAMNFSPLFIGLSFFLIVAALILTILVFLFHIEQRSREIGILKSLGFTQKQLKILFLTEGLLLCVMGSLLGALCAILYAQGMIWALTTVWSGAVASIPFEVFIFPHTIAMGFLISVLIAYFTLWFGIRKLLRAPALQLLSNKIIQQDSTLQAASPWDIGFWLSCALLIGAGVIYTLVPGNEAATMAGKFFGIGACILLAGIGFCRTVLLKLLQISTNTHLTQSSLAIRNNTRRRSRSLAVIGLLACGSFLVIAVGSNRHDATLNADDPSSGTGGYTYWGQTTFPLHYNLNTEDGLNQFGLTQDDVPALTVTHMRLRLGDEASCLNLNRAQTPQVLGVDPEIFSQREAFSFVTVKDGTANNAREAWQLLNQPIGENVIPAIADQATVLWALGKSIDDTLTYVDDSGNPFQIQFVGLLSNSIFQGHILIADDHFVRYFADSSGYQVHLFDMPAAQRETYHDLLSFSLQDQGLALTPTAERLAAFYQVENTYLSIFQILGGMGLILGCIGLGIIVMRNLLERRSEIALLKALGFSHRTIHNMVILEHFFLLCLGLGCGTLAGLLAALPAIQFKPDSFPYLSLGITMLIMLLNAGLWITLSTVLALRENTITALRKE